MLNPKTDLEQIKIDLKIDTDDDDKAILRAVKSSIAYVKGAIGKDKPLFYEQLDEEETEQINTAILMLADHYYRERSATKESTNAYGSAREYDLGFQSILHQLKASYLVYKRSMHKRSVNNGSK